MMAKHTPNTPPLFSDRLFGTRLEAPHECDDPTCPGNRNRLKLEAFDELVSMVKELQDIWIQPTQPDSHSRIAALLIKMAWIIAKAEKLEGGK